MHESHWGLRESPFRASLEPRFFHHGPTHEEALSRLSFLVENRRRLGLLLGGRGSGKSLLLCVLARDLMRRTEVVARVSLLGLEPCELLHDVARQWGAARVEGHELFTLWRSVTDRLVELRHEQAGVVLLLDDADQASPEVLSAVTRLLQADASFEARLTVVLAVQQGRAALLGARLLGLAELRIELEAWEEPDIQEFLTSALARAGRADPLFEPAAAARLHALTQGAPRTVCQLAELALLAGAGQGLSGIDVATINAVHQELAVNPGDRSIRM